MAWPTPNSTSTAASPPTITDSLPVSTIPMLPDTGASTMSAPFSRAFFANAYNVTRSLVLFVEMGERGLCVGRLAEQREARPRDMVGGLAAELRECRRRHDVVLFSGRGRFRFLRHGCPLRYARSGRTDPRAHVVRPLGLRLP